jgi:methionyl-tRNA formyltransferase
VRIAFVGLPIAALLLAEDGHDVVWAGICRKDAPGTRRLARRLGADRVAVVPDLSRVAPKVRGLAPELVVSWFWTRKVPAAFRALAPAIGVHPSLLPRHRGPDPFFWAIDAGDAVTGVTAHELEEDYDTGAILAQRELRVDPSWNAWQLAKKLDRPSLALLREVVKRYAEGAPPTPTPQDEARATPAPQPSDDDLELRWTMTSAAVARRVRAAAPWPGAFTELGGETVVLTRVTETETYPRVLTPGQAFVRRDGIAVVRTADGAVELTAGRFDADEDERRLGPEDLAEIVAAAREIEPTEP